MTGNDHVCRTSPTARCVLRPAIRGQDRRRRPAARRAVRRQQPHIRGQRRLDRQLRHGRQQLGRRAARRTSTSVRRAPPSSRRATATNRGCTLFEPCGKEVARAAWATATSSSRCCKGNFTTMQPSYADGTRTLTVTGLNVLHQLRRKQYTTSWTDKKDSEIAQRHRAAHRQRPEAVPAPDRHRRERAGQEKPHPARHPAQPIRHRLPVPASAHPRLRHVHPGGRQDDGTAAAAVLRAVTSRDDPRPARRDVRARVGRVA